jgi:hypothetical protein
MTTAVLLSDLPVIDHWQLLDNLQQHELNVELTPTTIRRLLSERAELIEAKNNTVREQWLEELRKKCNETTEKSDL